MSRGQAEACVAEAAASPLSDPRTHYPGWYLHRWHFLPEGYLSRRSVAGYDHVIRRVYHAGMERQALDRIVQIAKHLRPQTILEVGCGPGHAIDALGRALPGVCLTGIDLSPFMLERAKQTNADSAGVPEFVHASAASLPSEGGSIDVVLALHLLGHVPAAVATAAHSETARVLRRGGRLLAVDHWWHPEPPSPLQRVRTSWLVPGLTRLSVWAQASDGERAMASEWP